MENTTWNATISRSAAYCAAPPCVVRPEQMEGPYFVDERLDRSDIRADPVTSVMKAGVPRQLAIITSGVSRGGCRNERDRIFRRVATVGQYARCHDPGHHPDSAMPHDSESAHEGRSGT